MTISSTDSKTIYAGNDSTASFAIPFMFLRDEDIELVLSTGQGERTQTPGTDYTLTGAGDSTGGLCTLTVPPARDEVLVIRRNPSMVQEVDYVENDAFPAATHEAALDKLTMICQALSERLDRTITFRISSAVTGVSLPDPEPGRSLAWNAAGDDLANMDIASLDGVLLPLAVDQGGTGAQTALQALVNLGFGPTGVALATSLDPAQARAAMDAQPADPATLTAHTPDLLQAVFGDEAQIVTGPALTGLTVTRNHLVWTLTADSTFDAVDFPYDGAYVFHIHPDGHTLLMSAGYTSDGFLPDPDPAAGEIRIAVERFSGRRTIISLQNMGV